MIRPRWRKVLADLWVDKARSALMILTIAVGVFSVGFTVSIGEIAVPDMDADYAGSNGHSAVLYCDPFPEDLVTFLQRVPGVEDVEGRSTVTGRVLVDGKKQPIQLMAIPSPEKMVIDRLRLGSAGSGTGGGLPPLKNREMYLDRSALSSLKVNVGGTVTVELADGQTRRLKVIAVVHDVNAIPASFGMPNSAYVNQATVEWLGGPSTPNQVYLTVRENRTDKVHVTAVAQAVADKVEANGQKVYRVFVYSPGRHFVKDIFQAIVVILSVLGVLAVFLSTSLVVNIIHALLNQHIRFIGIMKAVGGRRNQIMGMYLTLVLILGGLAFLVAIVPSALTGYWVAKGLGGWLNFDVRAFRFSGLAVALQAGIALLVPVAAALVPVRQGTRMTIREAITSYGLSQHQFGNSRIDRLVERMRFLSRPLLVSLRNTFRRKTRLILTLCTLILAGAVFIGVFNLWMAINQALAELQGYYLADANVTFSQPYRLWKVQALIQDVPGVTDVEGWGYQGGQILASDRKSADEVVFVAPPNGSDLIKPILIAGRWLLPSDRDAIVIDARVLKQHPDLQVGSTLTTKIRDHEYTWRVVGIYKLGITINTTWVYVNYDYLSQLLHEPGLVSNVRVVARSHDRETQSRLVKGLEAVFQRNDIQVTAVVGGEEGIQKLSASYNVLVYFLLVMSVLVAVVGGLGLMGTMSMNVMERRREIGVMRAIGASNGAILRMILAEGAFVSLFGWCLALLASVPITFVLDYGVGATMTGLPLDFIFGLNGPLIWLCLALGIAALASWLPAWSAIRLTVREVLAYE